MFIECGAPQRGFAQFVILPFFETFFSLGASTV
jgi:hypothetical protein